MDTHEVVIDRIRNLMNERGWTENKLATESAVPQKTINSIFNHKSVNTGILTIKKLCDAFEITLGEFFTTKEFDNLEQEIQ